MNDLKDQLIKLGSEHPELQDNLKPILDHITKTAGAANMVATALEELGYRTQLQRGDGPTGDMPGLEKAVIFRNARPTLVVVPTGNTQKLIEIEEKFDEMGLDWDAAGSIVGGTKYEIHGMG